MAKKKRKEGKAKYRLKIRPVDIETAGEYATIDDLKRQAGIDRENKLP